MKTQGLSPSLVRRLRIVWSFGDRGATKLAAPLDGGVYGLSPDLRAKVEESIKALDYRPSVAARAMRGKTYTFGVLYGDVDNPFLPPLFQALQARAKRDGYKMLLGIGEDKVQIEVSLIEQMIDNQVDGIVLISPQMESKVLARLARQIPIVVIGHHEASASAFDTVNSDDILGGRLAAEHLIDLGYEDIAMISMLDPPTTELDVSPNREAGYLQAMAAAGLETQSKIERLPRDMDSRLATIERLLTRNPAHRALFCWSDLDAVPLLGTRCTIWACGPLTTSPWSARLR